MKVALASPYDFAYPGGVTAHVVHLYDELGKMGHEVKVIAPCSERARVSHDIELIAIGKPVPIPAAGSVARIAVSPWLSRQVKACLDRERFDVIHLHEPLISTLTLALLAHSCAVNVGTFHACHDEPRGYRMARPLIKRWFDRLDGLIAVSPPARDFAGRYLPGDYHIIPNGIDVEHFSADVPPMEQFCDGRQNCLFVGRLEKRKGLKYLLGAFRHVQQEVPQSRLIVVGPAESRVRQEYQAMARELGLTDVVFVGFAPYQDLPRYYRSADVFCAPATGEESFGIVLLEAMAASRPIVASAIDGYASVLSAPAEGLLVPPRDELALSQALVRLLRDEPLRQGMGARGRQKAERYSWHNVARSVLALYQDLL